MKSVILSLFMLLFLGSITTFGQGCFLRQSVSESLGEVSYTSGNGQLDTAIFIERNALSMFFGTNCAVVFYDDIANGDGKNAMFTPEVLDDSHIGGTIAFGKALLTEQLNFFNRFGMGGGLPFIFAHEMGHAKARQMGWSFKRGLTIKKDELFADYCAGIFMHYRKFMVPTDIQNTLLTFFQLGNYEFNNPGFHGTPQERVNSVMAGFNFMQYYKTNFPATPFTDYTLYTSAFNYLNNYVTD